jgi:hypothetical protein
MHPLLRTSAAACVAVLLSGVTLPAQDPAPQQTRAVPVKIAGCVERLMPAGTPPSAPAMYKLINTQPGRAEVSGGDTTSRPPQPPAVLDPEYLLAGAKPIDFAKYQNQRVEVTGIATATKPGAAAQLPDVPKQTLTVSAVQVVGTECKQGR